MVLMILGRGGPVQFGNVKNEHLEGLQPSTKHLYYAKES